MASDLKALTIAADPASAPASFGFARIKISLGTFLSSTFSFPMLLPVSFLPDESSWLIQIAGGIP